MYHNDQNFSNSISYLFFDLVELFEVNDHPRNYCWSWLRKYGRKAVSSKHIYHKSIISKRWIFSLTTSKRSYWRRYSVECLCDVIIDMKPRSAIVFAKLVFEKDESDWAPCFLFSITMRTRMFKVCRISMIHGMLIGSAAFITIAKK